MYTVQDGQLIYTRGEKNPSIIWRNIYQRAVSEANNIKSIYNSDTINTEVGARLISLGEAEFQKEKALLEKVGFSLKDENDIKEFIAKFNEVLIGKKNFEKVVERINFALDHKETAARAPTQASWFVGYLTSSLNQNIVTFIKNNLETLRKGDYSEYINILDDIIDKSIDEALKKMLDKMEEKKGKELYGDSETWKAYYEASQLMTGFNKSFKEMLKSKLPFDNLKAIFDKGVIALNKQKKEQWGVTKFIKSKNGLNLTSGRKTRSLGGSVDEFINIIATSMGEAVKNSASSQIVLRNEINKTDTISLFVFEESIEVEQIAETLARGIDEALNDNDSLNGAARRLKEYYDQNLSKLNNSFVVYGNAKSYSLSNTFRGFHNGGARSLEDLPQILSSAKVCNSNEARNFVYKLYNTAKYAIYENERESLTEEGKKIIMSAMANLLFDDWVTIGEQNMNGAQAIHVLQLEEAQIPLSVFLKASGKAIQNASQDMEKFFKVSLNIVKSAVPEWAADGAKLPVTASKGSDVFEEINKYWQQQAEIAAAQSTFTTTFFSNFKSIIGKWI